MICNFVIAVGWSERRAIRTDRPLHVAFVDDLGSEVPAGGVAMIRTEAYPAAG